MPRNQFEDPYLVDRAMDALSMGDYLAHSGGRRRKSSRRKSSRRKSSRRKSSRRSSKPKSRKLSKKVKEKLGDLDSYLGEKTENIPPLNEYAYPYYELAKKYGSEAKNYGSKYGKQAIAGLAGLAGLYGLYKKKGPIGERIEMAKDERGLLNKIKMLLAGLPPYAKSMISPYVFNSSPDYAEYLSRDPPYMGRESNAVRRAIQEGKEIARMALSNDPRIRKNAFDPHGRWPPGEQKIYANYTDNIGHADNIDYVPNPFGEGFRKKKVSPRAKKALTKYNKILRGIKRKYPNSSIERQRELASKLYRKMA